MKKVLLLLLKKVLNNNGWYFYRDIEKMWSQRFTEYELALIKEALALEEVTP